MKFNKLIIAAGLLAGAGSAAFVCATKKKSSADEKREDYFQKIKEYPFWSNSLETSIPEYRIYHHIHSFLDECEIKNSKAISKSGKIRKVLFLGFDGMRADALPYVLEDAENSRTDVSAIAELQKRGGLYLSYCGGEKGTETEETTSTSASWTSQFTGAWGVKHGIKTNNDVKNLEHKTFILEYAERGLNTCLAFDWGQYFDLNLKEEVKYVMDSGLPVRFCEINRVRKKKIKNTFAETVELYNFVAPEIPSRSAPYDTGMRDYVLERIEAGDSVVCGIFDGIDGAGHKFGFGESTEYTAAVINCDMYAFSILNAVKKREEEFNEEWLIIFANDHGGKGKSHGCQTPEERTTWIATNIPFEI